MNTAGAVRIEFFVKRQYTKFLQRFVLPLVFIVLIATSMPFLPPMQSGPRNQVCVIAMLTAVAFSNNASKEVPVTSQTTWCPSPSPFPSSPLLNPTHTRFDTFNIVSIVYPFVVIIENIMVQAILSMKREDWAKKLDQGSRVVFPTSYLIFTLGTLASATSGVTDTNGVAVHKATRQDRYTNAR